MRCRSRRWLRSAVLLAAAACGVPAAATPDQAALLDSLARADLRVATVAFRLLTAGVPVCADTAPASGLIVHDILQYSPELRPEATRSFGFDSRPAVAAVVPGGPADRAGIVAGDAFIAIGGEPVAASPPPVPDRRKPAHAAAEQVERRIAAAIAHGPADLVLARGGVARSVRLVPVAACASPVELEPGRRANAWSDGTGVAITSALVEAAHDDDELAFLIGHEIAHNILHHRRGLEAQGIGTGLLSRIGAKARKVRDSEREADRVGLYLAARAGYDPQAGARFWARFGAAEGDGPLPDATHPRWRDRAAALAGTAAEIVARQARGEPLTP